MFTPAVPDVLPGVSVCEDKKPVKRGGGEKKKKKKTEACYGGYAPCGSALVITLLQKYRFPLSPSNTTPELTHSLNTHPQTLNRLQQVTLHPPPPPPLTFISLTSTHFHPLVLHSFALVLHLALFLSLSLLVALFLHSIEWNVEVDAEQQSSPAALNVTPSSSSLSPCVSARVHWERPLVGGRVGGCVCLLTVSDTGSWGKVDLHSGLMRYNWLHSPTSRTQKRKQNGRTNKETNNDNEKKIKIKYNNKNRNLNEQQKQQC